MSVKLKLPVRHKFAARLKEACDGFAECPPLHQGRLTWLKERLDAEGVHVEVESVRKWLAGEMKPRQDKCEALGRILGRDPVWLYMGHSASIESSAASSESVVIPIPLRPGINVEIHNLPSDLTVAEAQRIANIVKAYAQPDAL